MTKETKFISCSFIILVCVLAAADVSCISPFAPRLPRAANSAPKDTISRCKRSLANARTHGLHDRCNWSPLRIRGGDIPGVVKALFLTALRNPVLVLCKCWNWVYFWIMDVSPFDFLTDLWYVVMAGSSLTTIYKSKIPHAQHLQGFLSFCTAVYVFYLLTVWQRMVQAETRAS